MGAHGTPVPVAEGRIPTGERNQTVGPCAEYSCGDGKCIAFKQVWPWDGDPLMPWDGEPSDANGMGNPAMPWDGVHSAAHSPVLVPCRGPCGVPPSLCLLGAQHRSVPQVCNGLPDCRDGDVASGWLPTDERDCGHWGPWAPWGICSRSCGLGQQLQARNCSQRAPGVLHQCHGEATQARPCFITACPGEWAWGLDGSACGIQGVPGLGMSKESRCSTG